MTIFDIEERRAQIAEEMNAETADIDALTNEARALLDRKTALETAEAERRKLADQVAAGTVGKTTEEHKEEKSMDLKEIRSSQEYIEAFANYIKTGKDEECRALLTENVSGSVPVPVIVDEIIRTAWERDAIMSRVRKTFIRGNLKVPFELSADPAYVHVEGTTAPTEESLTLGIVTMVPANIKKWIRISDEAVAMGGEAFLRYVYDELTYQIVKKLAALAIADIAGANTSSGSTAVGVSAVTEAPSVIAIPTAAANLSDEATNVVVVMNRLTEVEFLSAYAAGNFAVDPFAGLERVYTSALPAYSTASEGAVYAIVGDLRGEQFNFPEGDDVIIKWDDMTEAEKDLVKVVGREYAAHAVTGPGRLVNVKKPAAGAST